MALVALVKILDCVKPVIAFFGSVVDLKNFYSSLTSIINWWNSTFLAFLWYAHVRRFSSTSS